MVSSSECSTGEAKLISFTQTPILISSLTSPLVHPRTHSCGNCRTHLLLSRALAELIIECLIKSNSEWIYPGVQVHGKHKANQTSSTEFLWLNPNLLSVLTGTILIWAAHKLILYTGVKHRSTKQKINRNIIWKLDITNNSCEILIPSDSGFCPDLGINWSYKSQKPKLNLASTGHHYQQKVIDQ